MLTRSGYVIKDGPIQEIKKELTVRPIINNEFGFPPPPFRVYRTTKNGVCVPRFYGTSRVGEPGEDKRPEPGPRLSLLDNSETPPIRTPHLLRLLAQVMEFSRSHAGMERPPYPWR